MKVAVAGFGAIGGVVVRALDRGIDGLELVGLAVRDQAKARRGLAELAKPVALIAPSELAERADIVVDCAPAAAFRAIAGPAVAAGRTLVTVSGAALLEAEEVVAEARRTGARIILASGAILGLDGLRAAAEGEIHTVRMVTRKPPPSLAQAAYVREHGIDLSALAAPLKLFDGTAREGARLFPANVNVAAAVGLAGLGPDRTWLEIWADPGVERNTHTVEVDADSARFTITIENLPSAENPGTGRITALSVIATLRALAAPLVVGG